MNVATIFYVAKSHAEKKPVQREKNPRALEEVRQLKWEKHHEKQNDSQRREWNQR